MAVDLRATETAQLALLLDMGSDVYIHGPSGSGKSTIARRVIKPRIHEWLNCAMISGLKQVLRHLIYHYQATTRKVSTPAQFYLQYMDLPELKKQEQVILVLDQVDKLLNNDKSALYTLHKLRTDCHMHLLFVFISEVHFSEAFRHSQNVCVEFRPVPVFVPGLTKEEINLILRQEYRIEDEVRFEEFLKTVYPVFSMFSAHLDMFRFIYEKLYTEFMQKTRLDFQVIMNSMCDGLFDRREKQAAAPEQSADSQFLYKLLAVSTFICSHTSQKSDLIVFKRLPTLRRQKSKQSKYLDTAIQFPLDRLMGVFQILHFDIVGKHYRDSPRLDSTLGTLFEKKQVKAIQPGHLHGMKLLSFLTLEEAKVYAEELHIKLSDYIAE